MTKIVVVSDNHFQRDALLSILDMHSSADYFIHCGDSQFAAKDKLLAPFICVRGNNDGSDFSKEELIEIDGKKIFITHGHYQYVINYGAGNYSGTEELVTYVKAYNADIVFYGHTHVAEAHYDRGVYVLNPGSTDYPRGYTNRVPSYAVVTLTQDSVTARFFNAETHEEMTEQVMHPSKEKVPGLFDFLKKKK